MALIDTDAKRLEKAKALVASVARDEAPRRFKVGNYSVEMSDGFTTCDCYDYTQRRCYEGKSCKHGMAVEIAVLGIEAATARLEKAEAELAEERASNDEDNPGDEGFYPF